MGTLSLTPAFHEQLQKRLHERLEEYLDALSMCAAQDFADYKYRCGQIDSLREALVMAENTRKQMLEN